MITLFSQTLARLYEHAKAEFPEECCGVILQSDTQEFTKRCRNIQNQMHKENPAEYPRDARTAYLMHPDDLMAIYKEEESQDRSIKAFYHSHPNQEAYFSEKDKSDALIWGEPAHPGVVYLVISIYEDSKSIKAFTWDKTKSDYIEVPVHTTPPGALQSTSLKVRLTFPPEKITEPIIYTIGHQFSIVTNIRRANVTDDSGWVMLEIHGSSDEIERAIDYLKNINVKVEPVEGDVVQ